MNFQKPLAELVVAGRKTVTRRATSKNPRSPWWEGGCALKVGRDYAVCPGRGKDQIGRVEIVSTSQQTLGEAFGRFGDLEFAGLTGPLVEANREGFRDVISFQLAWLKINRTYDESVRVWRVEFRVDVDRAQWPPRVHRPGHALGAAEGHAVPDRRQPGGREADQARERRPGLPCRGAAGEACRLS